MRFNYNLLILQREVAKIPAGKKLPVLINEEMRDQIHTAMMACGFQRLVNCNSTTIYTHADRRQVELVLA